VNIHALYPWVTVVFAFSCLAAFGGFIWAWLVHVLHSAPGRDNHSSEYFWRNFILRVAVIGAATVPVVNAQFLANPDWEGTLSQYITLATLSGAAAIALTPTFRVLALPPNLPPNPFFRQAAEGTGAEGEAQRGGADRQAHEGRAAAVGSGGAEPGGQAVQDHDDRGDVGVREQLAAQAEPGQAQQAD